MLDRDKIKLFIDLTIRTHVGVGIAFAVCIAISGYVYSSGCGPVVASDNYGEAVDWSAATAHEMPGEAHEDHAEDHGDSAH